jgi:hypothetical protein
MTPPLSPQPDDDNNEEENPEEGLEKSENEEVDTGNNGISAMVTDDVTANSGEKGSKGTPPDAMQQKTSGVIFSPEVQKQFRAAQQELREMMSRAQHKNLSSDAHAEDGGSQLLYTPGSCGGEVAVSVAEMRKELNDADVDSAASVGCFESPNQTTPAAGVCSGGFRPVTYDGDAGGPELNIEALVEEEAGGELASPAPNSSAMSPLTQSAPEVVLLNSSALSPTRVSLGEGCSGGRVNMEGRPSREEMRAFGGLEEVVARSSARIRAQPNADVPSLERAVELACKKNLDIPKGTTNANLSILSFSDTEIKHRADRLGISLGKSNGQINSSILVIRKIERERSLIFLQKNLHKEDSEVSLVMRRSTNLCEDLDDDEDTIDGHADLQVPSKQIVKRGRKTNASSQRPTRRSARIIKLKSKKQ